VTRLTLDTPATRADHRPTMDTKARRLVAALAAVLLSSPIGAWAAAIPSKAEPAPARDADIAQVRDAIARAGVARTLADRGFADDAVNERLSRLSEADLRVLAANVDELQAAGEVPHYIWILLGIFLAVSILVMIF